MSILPAAALPGLAIHTLGSEVGRKSVFAAGFGSTYQPYPAALLSSVMLVPVVWPTAPPGRSAMLRVMPEVAAARLLARPLPRMDAGVITSGAEAVDWSAKLDLMDSMICSFCVNNDFHRAPTSAALTSCNSWISSTANCDFECNAP